MVIGCVHKQIHVHVCIYQYGDKIHVCAPLLIVRPNDNVTCASINLPN